MPNAKLMTDTIFAVLTLAKDSKFADLDPDLAAAEDTRIAPSYTKSLLDVYADFIDYCIEKSHSLDILCRYCKYQISLFCYFFGPTLTTSEARLMILTLFNKSLKLNC
jgi:hypothetical protein